MINPVGMVGEKINSWLWQIALKKVAIAIAKFAASYWLAHNAPAWTGAGALDPATLQVSIYGGFVWLRNYLKVKKGWAWL